MKMTKISIGIPVYLAEKNIANILRSLVTQKECNQIIKEILIYVDASTDRTVEEIDKVKDKRIKVCIAKTRGGMATGFRYLVHHFTGDVLLLLNDDILITDSSLIDTLIIPISYNSRVGLMSGNPQPLKPQTFIEKSILSTFRAYERYRYKVNEGNSIYACDGKLLVLTREFSKKLDLDVPDQNFGTIDAYLYFSCLKNGFSFRHVKDAKVYFTFPSSIREYIRWNSRNNANLFLLEAAFGPIVKKEFTYLPKVLLHSKMIEFVKNPAGSIFIFLLGLYCAHRAKHFHSWLKPTWETAVTTKKQLTVSV